LKLLARDLAIVTVAVLAWWFVAPLSAGGGAIADVSGFAAGLLLAACAYFAHEWGHLLGAVASRSAVRPPASLRSPFVFAFDSKRNSRRQFLAMSFAGFAATGAAIWAVYALLPADWLATRVARGAVLFLGVLGLVLEVPLVVYSLVSRRVPPLEVESRRAPPERRAAA
jgi:hypothetical protein